VKKLSYLILILILVGLGLDYYFYLAEKPTSSQSTTPTPTTTISSTSTAPSTLNIPVVTPPTPAPISSLTDPVANFKTRVTKKPFGIYITTQNSPVQPERFSGYHTGADAEYQDVSADVPVYAVADGVVVLSRTASGYGGVFMVEIELNGIKHNVLYGHIRPSSLPAVGQKVTRGQQIALLGTGYSIETDGERRHLHFAVLTDTRLDIKGYVPTKADLVGWLDPLTYFN